MKNPNYKKGTYKDSNGQMHKFVRTHEQDCSKCSRPDNCTGGTSSNTEYDCCKMQLEGYLSMGVGNFILKPRKERKKFKILLAALKGGEVIKVEGIGADTSGTVKKVTMNREVVLLTGGGGEVICKKDRIFGIRDIYGKWQERWK